MFSDWSAQLCKNQPLHKLLSMLPDQKTGKQKQVSYLSFMVLAMFWCQGNEQAKSKMFCDMVAQDGTKHLMKDD